MPCVDSLSADEAALIVSFLKLDALVHTTRVNTAFPQLTILNVRWSVQDTSVWMPLHRVVASGPLSKRIQCALHAATSWG